VWLMLPFLPSHILRTPQEVEGWIISTLDFQHERVALVRSVLSKALYAVFLVIRKFNEAFPGARHPTAADRDQCYFR
jgi:hypothetical protein